LRFFGLAVVGEIEERDLEARGDDIRRRIVTVRFESFEELQDRTLGNMM
jgi:hypothetical protein